MQTIVDYRIVEARYKLELTQQVRDLINKGWQPVGGVAFQEGHVKDKFLQAMVRYSG